PLKICQGDCDKDSDCEGSLKCFMRDGGEAVPGCSGGEDVASRADFCYDPMPTTSPVAMATTSPPTSSPVTMATSSPVAKPTSSPVTKPTSSPVAKPTSSPVAMPTSSPVATPTAGGPSVVVVGDNGTPSSAFPLKICQGDCDKDSDCEGSLKCFMRDGGEAVPGCSGGEDVASRADFCYDPMPTSSPVAMPSAGGPSVVVVGDNGTPSSAYPLKVCQGDCDKDSDCEGSLKCFMRDGGEAVPGCSGGESVASRADFCYNPMPTTSPVAMATSSPVAMATSSPV
ncbi:frustulin 5, partial [Phaeodactylum tricornutum CCAP 1055/1]